MSSILDDLPDIFNDALSDIFRDATFIHDTVTAGSPAADTFDPRAPTPVSYACKAIVELYSEYTRAIGFASESDRKIMILAKSLAVTPLPNDRVTIGGHTYTVLQVDSDPSNSIWELKSRI